MLLNRKILDSQGGSITFEMTVDCLIWSLTLCRLSSHRAMPALFSSSYASALLIELRQRSSHRAMQFSSLLILFSPCHPDTLRSCVFSYFYECFKTNIWDIVYVVDPRQHQSRTRAVLSLSIHAFISVWKRISPTLPFDYRRKDTRASATFLRKAAEARLRKLIRLFPCVPLLFSDCRLAETTRR